MKIKNMILFIFLVTTIAFSQDDRRPPMDNRQPPPRFMGPNKKFEQLEQLKLLESLNLDENTAIKFITRRKRNRDSIFAIMKKLDKVYEKIQNLVYSDQENKDYKTLIKKSFDLESKIVEKKKLFLNSLSDILTEEQIAKVIVFERKFKRDVRDILLDRGRKRILNN